MKEQSPKTASAVVPSSVGGGRVAYDAASIIDAVTQTVADLRAKTEARRAAVAKIDALNLHS